MRPFIAFDTATDHVAVAVGDLDRPRAVVAATESFVPRAANSVLLILIERVLSAAGIAIGDIRCVVCGRGPGSFTGVRIGISTAKGLAHGLGAPLAGLGSLDAVAWRVWGSENLADGTLLGVVGDAMRGEVYPALYRTSMDGPQRLDTDRVTTPAAVASEWAASGNPIVIAGGALAKHRAVFESVLSDHASVVNEELWSPSGSALVSAAWAAEGDRAVRAIAMQTPEEAFSTAHPALLLPIYTRLSDAEEAERGRCSGRSGPSPNGAARRASEGGRC